MTTQIHRIDRYAIEIDGHRIPATPDQERRLRGMTDEEITRFLTAMGRNEP